MKDVEIDESSDESYFIRLLTPRVDRVPLPSLRAELTKARLPLKLIVEAGTEAQWELLTLEHRQGDAIATIERLPVNTEGAGREMIAAFADSLQGAKPVSGANWAAAFLPTVKAVYSFQVLDAVEEDHGWDGLYVLQTFLHERLSGIFQSDGEGFSNEQGAHIVWQFDDDVQGPWNMAVLVSGRWQSFQMDLENHNQRRAFQEGKVPPRARRGK